jgi:hypothetical protein
MNLKVVGACRRTIPGASTHPIKILNVAGAQRYLSALFCLFVELIMMFSASFDLAERRKNRHPSAALQKP